MRTDKEILEVVLTELESKQRLQFGLCSFADDLVYLGKLTFTEASFFKTMIARYKVKGLPNYVGYYWKPGSYWPRVKFLKQIIEIR